ncbi:MAG: IclR family transcriptional regulator [Pseudomonadota bacterium]
MTAVAKTASSPRKPVRSVLRALAILSHLDGQGRGISDLSKELDLSKGTIFDLMKTLEGTGFVMQDPERDVYRLGPAVARLAARGAQANDLAELAQPHLQKLSNDAGETCHLAQRNDWHAVYKVRTQSQSNRRMLQLASIVGGLSPLHATSVGKVLLAGLAPDQFDAYAVQPREKFTKRTITDIDALKRECRRVRRQGHAINFGEFEEGVVSIAVPIISPSSGETIAAINIAMPAVYAPKKRLPELVVSLRVAADAIERDSVGF